MVNTGTRSAYASNGVKAPLMPQIDLPGGECVFISDKAVLDSFATISPPDRRYVIEAMAALIQEIRKDGSFDHVSNLGIVDSQKHHVFQTIDPAVFKDDLLLEFRWKVIQYQRFSKPSRLTEAIPNIEKLLTKSLNKPFHRLLGFYGVVAFSRITGKEEIALRLYRETTSQMIEEGSIAPIFTFLWVKANIARLARRMNNSQLAEDEESYVRNWILNNPWIISPDDIYKLIGDDIGTGANILNHPDVLSLFSYLKQRASTGNYNPMMEPLNSNLDLVIVDNETQTMSYDSELFPPDNRFRVL